VNKVQYIDIILYGICRGGRGVGVNGCSGGGTEGAFQRHLLTCPAVSMVVDKPLVTSG